MAGKGLSLSHISTRNTRFHVEIRAFQVKCNEMILPDLSWNQLFLCILSEMHLKCAQSCGQVQI